MEQLKQLLKSKVALIFFASIIICLYPIFNKIVYEQKNSTVEVVYDFETIKNIYLHSGVYYKDILKNFKKAGVTSIILNEDKVSDLINEGKATLIEGKNILNDNRIHRKQYNLVFSRLPRSYRIQPEYSYLIIDESNIFEFTKRNLEIKLGNNRVKDLGWNILEIISETEELMDISLDINPGKAALLYKYGFNIIPKISNHQAFTEEQIASKLSDLDNKNIKTIKFVENEALGYPDNLQVTAFKLNEINKFFGFTEFITPKGLEYLAKNTNDKAIKIHYLPISSKEKSIKRALRAVTERNARILHIDIITDKSNFSENIYDLNLSFLQDLQKRIKSKGLKIGTITETKAPSSEYIIGFKIVAYIAVLLLSLLFIKLFFDSSTKKQTALISFIYLITGLLFYLTNNAKLYNELLALLAAIISPTIIFILIKDILDDETGSFQKRLFTSLLLIFCSTIIIGILINTLLYNYNYFVAVWTFKGVKLANIGPMILLAIFFFIKPKRIKYLHHVLDRYLSRHLTFQYLAVAILLISFLLFYIMRTGNYGMLVLGQIEITFRELLETIFMIRPRTKEILFAFPLLIFAIHYWKSSKINDTIKLTVLLFASIASISQINTFCHLHSPFLLSTYRSLIGLIIGSAIGIFALIAIKQLYKIAEKISKRIYTWEN